MGMRVSSSSATWASQSASSVSNWQSRQQGMKDLKAALKSDDLTRAQQAFAALAKGNNIDSSSVLGQIGQALQNGDLKTAQKLSESMQGHHRGAVASAQSSQNQTSLAAKLRGQSSNIDLLA